MIQFDCNFQLTNVSKQVYTCFLSINDIKNINETTICKVIFYEFEEDSEILKEETFELNGLYNKEEAEIKILETLKESIQK